VHILYYLPHARYAIPHLLLLDVIIAALSSEIKNEEGPHKTFIKVTILLHEQCHPYLALGIAKYLTTMVHYSIV
jgi:hypothetical protein